MTRQEALDKIKELEEYIENLDKEVGYKEDKLFLLSTEEYENYKRVIPECRIAWWLRSLGHNDKSVLSVYDSKYDSIYDLGICNTNIGIRPALKIDTLDYKVGEIIVYKKFPYTVIDKDLCIATVPIAFNRFDGESNDYETSEVRKFLLKESEKNE